MGCPLSPSCLTAASVLNEFLQAVERFVPPDLREGGTWSLAQTLKNDAIWLFASAALFASVFPANIQMAVDASASKTRKPGWYQAVAWGRLPLQVPLVLWALSMRRRTSA